MISKNIEDVVVQVFSLKGRRETNYFIPQGMDGDEFSSFKNRNIIAINNLKDEIKESSEVDSILFEPIKVEGLSDNLDILSN